MQRYYCPHCTSEVHFENTTCVACFSTLGYVVMDDIFRVIGSGQDDNWRICANHKLIGCNWLIEPDDTAHFCASCRHTLVIPDLALNQNVDRWAKLERAKRILFYALHKFHLPLPDQTASPENWLRFEFKADQLTLGGQQSKVLTGHDNGLITINIAEADDAVRERNRVAMGEPYRTLLGHFRHEIGHYYWDRLVLDRSQVENFRALFGDERTDYGQALQLHYQSGSPAGWEQLHVSSYASAHPWEDFAETWAHYFHIVDGLETAQSYGISKTATPAVNSYDSNNCPQLIVDWVPLTITMNAMNRSMGNRDFYPFVMSEVISTKLQFVHDLIHSR
jgi:hypothetical protein